MKDFNEKMKKISRDGQPNKEQIRRNVKNGATVVMTESKEKRHPFLGTMLTAAASLLLIVGLIAGGTLVQQFRKPSAAGSDTGSVIPPDSEIRLTETDYGKTVAENVYFLYGNFSYDGDNGVSVSELLTSIADGKITVSEDVNRNFLTEELENITPDGLSEQMDCSLYLHRDRMMTFVLCRDTLYLLADHFGSYGLTGLVPAVFESGKEIGFFFNYMYGSGVDGRVLAYFDCNTGKVTEILRGINGVYPFDLQGSSVFGLAVEVIEEGETNRYILCNFIKTETNPDSSWDECQLIGELIYDVNSHSPSLILEDFGVDTDTPNEGVDTDIPNEEGTTVYPIFEKALVSKLQTREELLDLLYAGEKIVVPYYSENSETLEGIFFYGYFSENKEYGICYYDLSSDTVTTIGSGKDGKYRFTDVFDGFYVTVWLDYPTIVLSQENGEKEYFLCEGSVLTDGTYTYRDVGFLGQNEDGTWYLDCIVTPDFSETDVPDSETTIREDTVTEPFDTEPSSTDSFESEFPVTTDFPEIAPPETEPVTDPITEPEEPWTDPSFDASAEYAQGIPGAPANDKYEYYGGELFEVKYNDQGVEKTGTAYLCAGVAYPIDGIRHEDIYVTYFAVFAEDGSLVFARKWYGAGMVLVNSDTPDSILVVLKNANNDRQGWAFYGVYILDAAGPILSETCAYAKVSNVDKYNGETIGEFQKVSTLASNLLALIDTEYGVILDNLGGTLYDAGEISSTPPDRLPVYLQDKFAIQDLSSPASFIDEYLSMY